jgi:hypothetical protein
MIIIDRFWWAGTHYLPLLVLAYKSQVLSVAPHALLGDLQGLACPSLFIFIEEKCDSILFFLIPSTSFADR